MSYMVLCSQFDWFPMRYHSTWVCKVAHQKFQPRGIIYTDRVMFVLDSPCKVCLFMFSHYVAGVSVAKNFFFYVNITPYPLVKRPNFLIIGLLEQYTWTFNNFGLVVEFLKWFFKIYNIFMCAELNVLIE